MKKILLLGLILVLGLQNLSAMEEDVSVWRTELINTEGFEQGMPPLHVAIQSGDFLECERLLSVGVDVNERCQGKTPMECAFKASKVNIFQLLLSYGAEIPETLFNMKRPLDNGSKYRRCRLAIFNLLKKCKYIFNTINGIPDIYKPFAQHPFSGLSLKEKIADLNGCVNFKINGRSLLLIAIFQRVCCNNCEDDIIQTLLDNGADVCLCDNNGLNAFSLFFVYSKSETFATNVSVLRMLLRNPKASTAILQRNSGTRRAISPFSFAKVAADGNPELNQIMQEFSAQNCLDW